MNFEDNLSKSSKNLILTISNTEFDVIFLIIYYTFDLAYFEVNLIQNECVEHPRWVSWYILIILFSKCINPI